MKIYKDKTMSEQTFVIEETAFYDCTLKDCDLFYSGGDFEMVTVKLDNCRIHFRGAAKNTQQLMMTVGMLKNLLQLPPQSTTSSNKAN